MPQYPIAGPTSYGRQASGADFGGLEAEAQGQRGGAIAQIGGVAAEAAAIADRVRKAADQMKVGRQAAEYAAGLDRLRFDLQSDPNIDDHEARFEKGSKELFEATRKSLPPALHAQLEDRVFPALAHSKLEVSGDVRTRRLSNADADRKEMLRLNADQAAQTPDAVRRAQIKGQTVGALDSALASGLIQQGEYDASVRAFDKSVSEADVRKLIREDPAAAFRRLGNPADPLAAGYDQGEREQLRTQALTEHEQQLAQGRSMVAFQQAQQDRAEKKAADVAQRNADDALMKGDAAALNDILDRSRNVMTPEQRRWYLERIAKGGGMAGETSHTNPGVYVDLATRAARGDAIPDEIDGAYRAGGITREDRDRLFKASEDRRFGEVSEFIRHATTQGIVDFDPIRQLKSAEVQRQFAEWSAAHPDATPTEALEQGRGLLRVVGIKDGAELIRPSDARGPDGKVDVGPLIQQAMDRAARGELDPTALGMELKRLKDLEDAQQRAGSPK